MKVYVVICDDMDEWCIKKMYREEVDAVSYCDEMNSRLGFNLYRYEERELE